MWDGLPSDGLRLAILELLGTDIVHAAVLSKVCCFTPWAWLRPPFASPSSDAFLGIAPHGRAFPTTHHSTLSRGSP